MSGDGCSVVVLVFVACCSSRWFVGVPAAFELSLALLVLKGRWRIGCLIWSWVFRFSDYGPVHVVSGMIADHSMVVKTVLVVVVVGNCSSGW